MTSIAYDSASRRVVPLSDARIPGRASPWRAVAIAAIALLTLVPVGTVLSLWATTTRNVAYWDEIDAVLPFLVQLNDGMNPERFVGTLLSVTNEHRTATSRLLFALSYWSTGTVDFVWIGALGNAFIVAACGLLVWSVRPAERRLQLALILGFMVFHLGSYENFLWSGSSIDHFLVLALAVAALLALNLRGRAAFRAAMMGGTLASFTLAHGLVVWPVGAVVLARERRWTELACWVTAAALAGWIFLAGFYWNTGHLVATTGTAMVRVVLLYWLELLGAPMAFGHPVLATALGAVLVLAVALRSVFAWLGRARAPHSVLWFLVGAALLIAFGRAEFVQGHVFSRYFIIGSLAWSLVIFEALNLPWWRHRPLLALGGVAPLLVGFNTAQNIHYRADAATFVEHRDRAALRYRQFGEDGHAPLTLHPDPGHATRILATAARRGVYEMPALCTEATFADAKPSTRIDYCVDEFTLNDRAAYLAGWATLRDEKLDRGEIHVVLRSAERTVMFTTVPQRRRDVAAAFKNDGWEWSGFRFALLRDRLPPADYQIGFLIAGDSPELVMTEHRLDLRGAGKAFLARRE